MTTRILQFFGHGYGNSSASTSVTANGNVIFNGTVTTLDQPPPAIPLSPEIIDSTVPMFALEVDINFSGFIPMTCTVTNQEIIFAQIRANYVQIGNPAFTPQQRQIINAPETTQQDRVAIYTQVANPPLSQQDIDTLLDLSQSALHDQIKKDHKITLWISTGPNHFVPLTRDNGQTSNADRVYDPRANVAIDGVPQYPDHQGDTSGTWWWNIKSGSVLSYDLEVTAAAASTNIPWMP